MSGIRFVCSGISGGRRLRGRFLLGGVSFMAIVRVVILAVLVVLHSLEALRNSEVERGRGSMAVRMWVVRRREGDIVDGE